MTRVHAAMVLAVVAALGGCGSNGKGKKKVQDVFVHGDPMAIVAGTTPSVVSPFTTADVAAFADFNLYGGAYFQEISRIGTATDAEQGNEASEGETVALDSYGFEQRAEGWLFYSPVSGKGGIELLFTDTGGTLALAKVRIGLETVDVEPVHYSVTAAKDAFSLLMKTTDPADGAGLLALYFTKNATKEPKVEQVDTKYKYLLGPGVKAAWEGAIQIDLCGTLAEDDALAMREGIESWATGGLIGSRALTVGTRAEHPPFTDLGSRCVQLVDGFAFEDQEDLAVYGITLSTLNKTTATIVGSNIIVAESAFKKTPRATDPEKRHILMRYVASHEFGHFIGLDHEFTKNPDGTQKYASVMSYEFDGIEDPAPRAHDREATALLYP